MKKSVLVSIGFLMLLISSVLISAEACQLQVSLLNQDPYPAIPGEYVEVVFQVEGVENSECGAISFELLEKYPIEFDPGQDTTKTITGGTFVKDYTNYLMVPYKVRVRNDALDGNTPIEVSYSYEMGGQRTYESKQVNLKIEDVRADFEVFVKDYDATTKTISFEILNTAKNDIQALTVEVPSQESIKISGANKDIVGDLDSNEYTSADFSGTPKDGNITLVLSYSDAINKRRTVEKSVVFDSKYFNLTPVVAGTNPYLKYGFWIVVIGAVYYFFFYRKKKKSN
jgi:hypothetical protein